jgi:hypothetical protein
MHLKVKRLPLSDPAPKNDAKVIESAGGKSEASAVSGYKHRKFNSAVAVLHRPGAAKQQIPTKREHYQSVMRDTFNPEVPSSCLVPRDRAPHSSPAPLRGFLFVSGPARLTKQRRSANSPSTSICVAKVFIMAQRENFKRRSSQHSGARDPEQKAPRARTEVR